MVWYWHFKQSNYPAPHQVRLILAWISLLWWLQNAGFLPLKPHHFHYLILYYWQNPLISPIYLPIYYQYGHLDFFPNGQQFISILNYFGLQIVTEADSWILGTCPFSLEGTFFALWHSKMFQDPLVSTASQPWNQLVLYLSGTGSS